MSEPRPPRPPRLPRRLRVALPALSIAALVPFVLVLLEQDEITPAVGIATVAVLAVQAAVLLVAPRRPRTALVAVVVLDTALAALDPGNSSGGLAVALAVAAVRLALPRRSALHWLVPAAAVTTIVIALVGPGQGLGPLWNAPLALARTALLFALPFAIAEALDGRRRLVEALRERAESAERERDTAARHALQQQRTMIARELHDIAAHRLTGIVVSAQAARALARTDPGAQAEYLDAVQADARAALDSIRSTVGLLRVEEQDRLQPAPSLADLPGVIADAAAHGLDLEFRETGDAAPVAPVAGVVVIRGVQEGLANAARHAPGAHVVVALAWGRHRLEIIVEDDGPAAPGPGIPAGGHGLVGLRERVALVGGEVRAGPSGSGWATSFTVPVERPEGEETT